MYIIYDYTKVIYFNIYIYKMIFFSFLSLSLFLWNTHNMNVYLYSLYPFFLASYRYRPRNSWWRASLAAGDISLGCRNLCPKIRISWISQKSKIHGKYLLKTFGLNTWKILHVIWQFFHEITMTFGISASPRFAEFQHHS